MKQTPESSVDIDPAPPTRKKRKPSISGNNRPPAGFYEDDVPILVERWLAYATAYDGEPSKRYRRLADQLEKMIADGRCTFTRPVVPTQLRRKYYPQGD